MQILDNLFGAHTRNLGRSLNRVSLRQSVLSGNLANINTPGYKRRDVDFGIELETAKNKLTIGVGGSQPNVRIVPGALRIDGNGVDLEKEIFALSENEIRYQTLTQMTRGYFRGLKNVIRGGR